MKFLIPVVVLFLSANVLYSQKELRKNKISVSLPVIWNTTTIYNSFSGARAGDIKGDAVSHGVNLAYKRSVHPNFFIALGVGLFTQKFGIQRPFIFDDPTNLLFTTKWYKYANYHYLLGIAYQAKLSNKYNFEATISYNGYETYRQEFRPLFISNESKQSTKVRNVNYKFGESFIVQGGINRKVYKDIKAGMDILIPFYTRWKKDEVFLENPNDTYHPGFSAGLALNISYTF